MRDAHGRGKAVMDCKRKPVLYWPRRSSWQGCRKVLIGQTTREGTLEVLNQNQSKEDSNNENH